MNREEANGLTIIQQSQKGYIDKVIACIENGRPLLLENLPDDIDAVLDSVVGKQTMKRGQNLVIKIGDSEVDYDRNFRLYLQTKLSNPHYKPEINAQVSKRKSDTMCPCEVCVLATGCIDDVRAVLLRHVPELQTTLVNFCVTEKGLEDQLLALVVEHERPDLQEQAQALVKQLGDFTITLKNLEDNLLTRLANSQGDILEDIELIENLEETKRTAVWPAVSSTASFCLQIAEPAPSCEHIRTPAVFQPILNACTRTTLSPLLPARRVSCLRMWCHAVGH